MIWKILAYWFVISFAVGGLYALAHYREYRRTHRRHGDEEGK